MDPTLAARIFLPLLLVAFAFVLMVWPVVRLRRETGASAIVLHRENEPGQRVMAVAFLATLLAVAGLVALYSWRGPTALGVWALPGPVTWLGLGVALAGLVLVAVAQRQMGASFRIGIDDAETALVEDGLFGVVRNPIFTALLVLLAGVFLAAPCAWTLGLWVVSAIGVGRQVRLEERHLLAQHGDAYRRYGSRVGRFVPGVGRLRPDETASGTK